ncbi:MAG: serine/threonine-protein phosphatase, partial [Clostridia bacterium]|nr:serine/threonine-protein phosphatase [Clostridia bacterium]
FDTAKGDPELQGMGTTVVAAVVCGQSAVVAHVGDSRAYLVTATGIEQVTRDHSLVQEMVERGRLTQSEAKNHPRKHFITRAIGVEDTVECDINEVEIPAEGELLICTDGLTNMVETEEIFRIARSTPPEAAADRLISTANMAGGSDNITVALIA